MALSLHAALHLRRVNGWVCSLLLTASLLCLADGLAAGFRGEGRVLTGLAGMELAVTAPLPPETDSIDQLRILGQSEHVRLVPEALYSGYWLGGTMWRGKVVVDAQAGPGDLEFRVEGPLLAPPPKPPIVVRVSVFETPQAMQAASPSLLTRQTGREPFPVSALLFALALPGLGLSYLLSQRVERLMAQQGRAVITQVKRAPGGDVLSFSLGARNGLTRGETLDVSDAAGRALGRAVVTDCLETDAVAELRQGTARPGDIVAKQSYR